MNAEQRKMFQAEWAKLGREHVKGCMACRGNMDGYCVDYWRAYEDVKRQHEEKSRGNG